LTAVERRIKSKRNVVQGNKCNLKHFERICHKNPTRMLDGRPRYLTAKEQIRADSYIHLLWLWL